MKKYYLVIKKEFYDKEWIEVDRFITTNPHKWKSNGYNEYKITKIELK